MMCTDTGLHADQTGWHIGKPCLHLAPRPLLPQHDCATLIEADDVERVLADIDADHGDRIAKLLSHGRAPFIECLLPAYLLTEQEHGRTIPLAVIPLTAVEPIVLRRQFHARSHQLVAPSIRGLRSVQPRATGHQYRLRYRRGACAIDNGQSVLSIVTRRSPLPPPGVGRTEGGLRQPTPRRFCSAVCDGGHWASRYRTGF